MVKPAKYIEADAVLSPCGKYRYRLWRTWGTLLLPRAEWRTVAFIMLNPSTADAEEDDPTIRTIVGMAKAWRFHRLVVGNLFAWRETEPRKLQLAADPVGPENDNHLQNLVQGAELVVAAWGRRAPWSGRKDLAGRDKQVVELVTRWTDLHALVFNQDGTPAHPLYKSHTLRPVLWQPRKLAQELTVERES